MLVTKAKKDLNSYFIFRYTFLQLFMFNMFNIHCIHEVHMYDVSHTCDRVKLVKRLSCIRSYTSMGTVLSRVPLKGALLRLQGGAVQHVFKLILNVLLHFDNWFVATCSCTL